jgi:hypothetical protein
MTAIKRERLKFLLVHLFLSLHAPWLSRQVKLKESQTKLIAIHHLQSYQLPMLSQLNSKTTILSLGLIIIMAVAMFSSSILSNSTFNNYLTSALAQPFVQTVERRDLVIDLGNGITTNAQLTIPAVGNGPFPGVLLVAGSGAIDMNETLSPDSKPFWQIV